MSFTGLIIIIIIIELIASEAMNHHYWLKNPVGGAAHSKQQLCNHPTMLNLFNVNIFFSLPHRKDSRLPRDLFRSGESLETIGMWGDFKIQKCPLQCSGG